MTALAAPPPLAVHRSRKLIPNFRLHRPRTASEAAAIKGELGPGAVYMAGGIDVINRMKFGGAVSDVIHLGQVAGLDGIDQEPDRLRLGALVTHDRLATAPEVRARLPDLARTGPDIANIRVRCKGTIGGNVMAGDAAYDFALAAMAAGARLHFLGTDGAEILVSPADRGNAGPDDLLTAITFPVGHSLRLFFDRSLRPVVTVVVGLDVVEGAVIAGRVAIGCAYRTPLSRALPFDRALSPDDLDARAETLAQAIVDDLPEPVTDHHASAGYRRRMIGLLVQRHLRSAP